jgi:hypothetical protein
MLEVAVAHGRQLPLIEALAGVIAEIESGRREMSWDNIAELAHVNSKHYGNLR